MSSDDDSRSVNDSLKTPTEPTLEVPSLRGGYALMSMEDIRAESIARHERYLDYEKSANTITPKSALELSFSLELPNDDVPKVKCLLPETNFTLILFVLLYLYVQNVRQSREGYYSFFSIQALMLP